MMGRFKTWEESDDDEMLESEDFFSEFFFS